MQQEMKSFSLIRIAPLDREAERLRSKARHDEAQALHHARREGSDARAISIAKMLLNRNRPIDEIAEDTGLTREEIEGLGGQN